MKKHASFSDTVQGNKQGRWCRLLNWVAHPAALHLMEQKPPNPVSLHWLGLGGYRQPSYPFTGMVAGLASLNVNLLLAARRVTSLLALALAASLASVLGWLFGPTIELVSSG